MSFPPPPLYPVDLDSNYTLFLVYNTTESLLVADNPAWSAEVLIEPVAADKPEIWADNGWGNIEGELFYYDSVEKDINNKVFKLKGCARNLGGTPTQYNTAGVVVRGFVIAEHHNQLVETILRIEDFVGENFSEDMSTLDFRIRHLQSLPIIFDDSNCPEVDFTFNITENDPSSGVLIEFNTQITGDFTEFIINFGDGTTTTALQGTHRYAHNTNIDPTINIKSDRCEMVQTPIERTNPIDTQQTIEEPPFEIPIPEVPNIPDLVIPGFPTTDFNLPVPPIVFPCLELGQLSTILPSIIVFEPPINIPSHITFGPVDIPSFIDIPTLVSIISPTIPTIISVVPNIPSIISFSPLDIPSIISFSPLDFPSLISVAVSFISIPSIVIPGIISVTPISISVDIPSLISVNIPTLISITPVDIPTLISVNIPTLISVNIPTLISINTISFGPVNIPTTISFVGCCDIPSIIAVSCCTISFAPTPVIPPLSFTTIPPLSFSPIPPLSFSPLPTLSCVVTVICPSSSPSPTPMAFGENFVDDFNNEEINIDISSLGIPKEIQVIAPKFPDIKVIHDIPIEISLISPLIPTEIRIISPDIPLPAEIKIVGVGIPTEIPITTFDVPKSIQLDATNVPRTISLEIPDNFPKTIVLDATNIPKEIQVIGIPSAIELIGKIPSRIELVMPENPTVEMKYSGAPIDVKIELDIKKLLGDNENGQCVMIVPCAKS